MLICWQLYCSREVSEFCRQPSQALLQWLTENFIEKFEHLRNMSLHAFVVWYHRSHRYLCQSLKVRVRTLLPSIASESLSSSNKSKMLAIIALLLPVTSALVGFASLPCSNTCNVTNLKTRAQGLRARTASASVNSEYGWQACAFVSAPDARRQEYVLRDVKQVLTSRNGCVWWPI
jgi:hypothetical protein